MKSKKQMPDSWEVVRLGDVAEINQSNWNPGQGSTILYLDLTSVIEPGILAPPKELAAKEAPSRARRQVRPGDILVSTVRPNLRGFARVPEAARNLVASTGFAVVSPRRTVNGSFVYQHVMTSQFAQYLENAATGQAYPAVLASDVAGFTLPIPPLPEQRAIAAVLDSIDEAIERTEAVIAAIERLRDALLHELLTRGVPGWHSKWKEAPGIGTVPACWEVVRLGDMAERITKGTTPTTLGREYSQTGVRFLRVGNVTDGGTISEEDQRFIDDDTHTMLSRSVLRENDFVLSIAGTLGRSALITRDILPANVNQALAIIRLAIDAQLLPKFLSLVLRGNSIRLQIEDMRVELAQANISLQQVKALRVALPATQEQRHIADMLAAVDDTIERGRAEMNVLQTVKASATDALLTGRVRVRNHNV